MSTAYTKVVLTVPTHELAGFLIQQTRDNPTNPLLSAEDALLAHISDRAEVLFLTGSDHAGSNVTTRDCATCAPHIHAFTELQNALSVLNANYGDTSDSDAPLATVTSAVDSAFVALAQLVLTDYARRNGETLPLPLALLCTCYAPDTLECDVHGPAI